MSDNSEHGDKFSGDEDMSDNSEHGDKFSGDEDMSDNSEHGDKFSEVEDDNTEDDLVEEEAVRRLQHEVRALRILWYSRENEYPEKQKRRTRVKCSLSLCQNTIDELEKIHYRGWLKRTVLNEQKLTSTIKQFSQFIQHYRRVILYYTTTA